MSLFTILSNFHIVNLLPCGLVKLGLYFICTYCSFSLYAGNSIYLSIHLPVCLNKDP